MKQIFIIVLFILPIVHAEVYITEVMYNPPDEDNNKEYLELFSEEFINLTDYIIEDFHAADNLTLVQQANVSFYLIVEEGFNITGINASVYSAGATIGNNLNNEGDIVSLRKNNRLVDIVIYASSLGASNDGKSLCRKDDVFKNRLFPCEPSPGAPNTEPQQPQQNTTENTTASDVSTIRISEVLPDPIGSDSAPLPHGEWIELFNNGDTQLDLAGIKLKDKSENSVTISSANVVETTIIQPQGYLVVYMHGNSMLNNNGFEQVRLIAQRTTIDEMSYVDSRPGKSWSKIDDTFKITNATPGAANLFYEAEEQEQPKQEKEQRVKQKASAISIAEVKPSSDVKFGDVLKVRINAYHGDTRKNSVQIGITNVGHPIAINLFNKYTNYTMHVPVQIKENCDGKLAPGNYTLSVRGFGVEAQQLLVIKNGECTKRVYSAVTTGNAVAEQESFINSRKKDTQRILYESAVVRIEKYATYFVWAVAILIIGYIIYESKIKGKFNY